MTKDLLKLLINLLSGSSKTAKFVRSWRKGNWSWFKHRKGSKGGRSWISELFTSKESNYLVIPSANSKSQKVAKQAELVKLKPTARRNITRIDKTTLQEFKQFAKSIPKENRKSFFYEMLGSKNPTAREIKKIMNQILKKKISGKELTQNQKEVLNLFEEVFVADEMKYLKVWVGLNSSWLVKGFYVPQTKLMPLIMVRGKSIYTFYSVPKWFFLGLVMCESHAGTYAWRNNIWKYSLNKNKRLKRRRY